MKPITLLFLFLFGVTSVSFSQSHVIPTPQFYEQSPGESFKFSILIADITGLPKGTSDVLLSWNNTFRHLVEKKSDAIPVALKVRLHQTTEKHPENDFYELSFNGKFADIQYTTPASLLYAYSTLLQLIEDEGNQLSIHPFTLKDHAQFPWRGLHLDVCRHFFTVDEVKRYIDIMSFYKYNTFHWHLTDDQGWRIEIKKYPLLTEIGAYRDSTLNDHYNTSPRTWNTEHYGGFYTQEQIKEVVRYASDRGVTIVPEIEMPGHARAALAAYPQLSCTGMQQPVTGLWGVFDDIFCSKQETISFLQDVLTEVIELFPSEYIHIGGDEAPKTRWKACEKCQNNIRSHQLKDEHELQSWFIRQMDEFLTKKGRKLIGWDEILEGGLSPNAAVMSWRGEEGGIAAANEQHEVVMTPGSHCYFDHYQGDSQTEPLAFGGYTPLEKVYAYNPVPSGISAENKQYILGAQANLWTEYIADFKQVEYMVYPRALAMIQNTWSENKPDYQTFIQTLSNRQFDLLKAWNVNYALSFSKPVFQITKEDRGIVITGTSIEKNPVNMALKCTSQKKGKELIIMGSSIYFSRSGSDTKTYRITAFENKFHSSSTINFINHKGIGLDIEFITPPNKRYAHNLESTLIDGILGARPWNGSQWLGFNQGNVEFIVRTDEKINYKSVIASALNATTSWIHLPESIIVYASDDGNNWKEIARQKVTGEQTKIALKGKHKQLKFVYTALEAIPEGMPGEGYKPFTFLDELIFE
ncbi:MAG: beta-N-acetylhexosaminidase [Crocinitomicaceae bacterium]|nr:beta-N-acetylhexosaminidase [Crocinitomicaceae bacterium]